VHSLEDDEHPFCILLIPKSNQISGRLRSYSWLAHTWASFQSKYTATGPWGESSILLGTLNIPKYTHAGWDPSVGWSTQRPGQSILPQLHTLCQSCVRCTSRVSHSGPTWLILCILKPPDLLRLQLLNSDASSNAWTRLSFLITDCSSRILCCTTPAYAVLTYGW
jgi:hypothetical protein